MLENALLLSLYSKENSIPLKFLRTLNNEIVDTTKAITEDITTFFMIYKYSIEETIMVYYYANKDKDDEELSTNITLFLKNIGENDKVPNYSLVMMKDVKRGLEMRWDAMLETTNRRLEKLTVVKEFFDGISLEEETKEALTNSFTEENVVKLYLCEYNRFQITEENIKFVFNEFRTDPNLYYIEYVDSSDKSLIKVHESADKNNLEIEEREPNNIYFKYKHQNDIIDIKYNINSNKLEYSYYAGKDGGEIDAILNNVFVNFKLSNQKTLFVSGSFSIEIKNYKEYNFYYFIFMLINLLNSNASNIVYTRETFNPRALKKRTKFYFRDFENINHIDYIMSFTIDNIVSNLYNIKYRAKNREKDYILEIAYLIKKYLNFYEENATTTEGGYVSDYFVNTFYGKTFEYQERSYSKIPTKIANLRNKSNVNNMFPGGGEYTKSMCECKLQPIVIDKEDVKDWERYEDFDNKGRKIKHNALMFPPENSSQGPKRYYVCPTHKYPIPVLKPNTGSNAKEYPYLPCCKMTGRDEFYNIYEETRIAGKGPIISLKQSDVQSRALPLPLQTFFKTLMEDEVEIQPTEVSVNDSFIACLLEATKNYNPPPYYGDKNRKILEDNLKIYKQDYKSGVKKLRQNINKFRVYYETAKQEMFDYTNDDIIGMLTGENYIDSMLFFKFFEYIFTVNIFVFGIDNGNPILEKPRYKDFHVRNIIEEYPAVYLYRDSTTLEGRYSLIAGNKTLFSSKPFENLLQPYYKTDIENNKVVVRMNPYKGIIWEKIFKNYRIVSQRINENGKCYCINIQIEKFGISVYVPPSAPLNVPVSDRIFRSSLKTVLKYFQEGELGNRGMWIMINGLRSVFIPCSDVKPSLDICFDYVKDIYKNQTNDKFKDYKVGSKNSSIFVELCIWLWRVSGLSLEQWFEEYVNVSEIDETTFEKREIKGNFILPKYNSVQECIGWIRENNPEYETVFKDEQIHVYPKLKDNLYLYMKKVESLTDGLPNDPNEYMDTMLSSKKEFQRNNNEFLFDDLEQLEDWIKDKFHNLEVFDTIEPRGIYIYRDDKGMYLMFDSDSIGQALLLTLYWNKLKKMVDKDTISGMIQAVIRRVGYKLYDSKLKLIKEDKKDKMIDVIFYNVNLYSTFIKLI